MLITVDARIPFPRSLVFATYRDRLDDLVPYLPNIRGVEARSRQEKGGRLECVNEWHGGGDIPSAARAFLNESMLSWTEFAAWDAGTYTTEWQIQTHAFTEAVRCSGTNRFIDRNGLTLVESRGELKIDPHKIADVPPFIAGMVSKIVEDFLSKKIGPNLLQMSDGVRMYLEQQSVTPIA